MKPSPLCIRPSDSLAPRSPLFKAIGRHLAVVIVALGCLATSAPAAPSDQDEVIVPKTTAAKPAVPAAGGTGMFTTVAVLLLAGAGGWLLWRGRSGGLATLSRAPRQLIIEETRPLGNRQFVVVAAYQNKKFLLGVCPGRIEFLAPLTDATPAPEKARS